MVDNNDRNDDIKQPEVYDTPSQIWYVKNLPGMNNKSEELELGNNYVKLAQNCRFEDRPGAVVKRPPTSYFNTTTIGSDPIVGLFRFYPSAKFICAAGTGVYVGDDATGVWTQIRTLSTSGNRMAFQVYKDLLFCSNGFDNIFVYDGSDDNVTWELGSCKAVIGSSTGITQTNISYTVTFDGDALVSGSVSNEIASTTNEDIELSQIPLGPIGTTDRKIYRKDSNTSGTYRLVTTISDNTTTTYTDSTNDVSGAAALPVVTDELPKGNILNIHRERLFISGDSDNPSRIYYSEAYYPHYIQVTTNLTYMEISPEDNDEIMGIPVQLGTMVCIKKNSIRKLWITQATFGADPAQWYAEDPIVFSGSPAQWSIIQTPYGVVYLGWDHWYLFDGQQNQVIVDQFDTEEVLPALYSQVVAHYDYNKGVLLAAFSLGEVATNYNNRCMVYNWRRNKMSFDTLDANCFASKIGDDENGDLFYGSSVEGFVYQAENNEINYRLRKKSQANDGTKTQVFVGGTEDEPYIEIGQVTAASEIPDNICIFWDGDDTPGPGWNEFTTADDFFIKISTDTVGVTGTLGVSDPTNTEVSANAFRWRVFRRVKGANPAIYEFPENTIVMFGESYDPTGYEKIDENYYVRVHATAVTDNDIDNTTSNPSFPDTSPTADGEGENLDTFVKFRFIKKIGEQSTWDGLDHYVYCLLYDDSWSTTNGWEDVTDTTEEVSASCTADDPLNLFNTTTAHGLEDDERVRMDGDTLPTGINNTTSYWVVNATDNTFQVSTSQGGAVQTFTGSGSNMTYNITREIYNNKFIRTADTGPNYVLGGDTTTPTDYIRTNEVVHVDNYSVTAGSLQAEYGSPPDVYDNDISTRHGWRAYHSGDGWCKLSASTYHNWTTPRHIDSVYLYLEVNNISGGNYTQSSSRSISVNYVTTTGSYALTSASGSDRGYTVINGTYDNGGAGWDDVIGIVVDAFANTYSYEGTRSQTSQVSFYSVEAYGPYNYIPFRIARKVLGKMLDYNGSIDSHLFGTGTWTSPTLNIKAETLGLMYWHEILVGSDDITFDTRSGSTEAALLAASWDTGLTDANGSPIASAANQWFQYRINFSASDTTTSNPRVYMTDDYVVKITYQRGADDAEASVEFIYDIGFRNFNMPFADKIFKKFLSRYEGEEGSFTIDWECENGESGTFNVSLDTYPTVWESFFQANAFGRELKVRIYKNDLYDFKLYEMMGAYANQPVRL